jgi:hypothetical protein
MSKTLDMADIMSNPRYDAPEFKEWLRVTEGEEQFQELWPDQPRSDHNLVEQEQARRLITRQLIKWFFRDKYDRAMRKRAKRK